MKTTTFHCEPSIDGSAIICDRNLRPGETITLGTGSPRSYIVTGRIRVGACIALHNRGAVYAEIHDDCYHLLDWPQKCPWGAWLERAKNDAIDGAESLGHFDSHGRFLDSPEPCDWAGVPLADRAALAVFTENLDGKGSLMPDVGCCSKCGRGTMFRSSLGTVCGFPEGEEKCPGVLVPLN